MTIAEYFKDWMKVIDKYELQKALNNIKGDICPNMKDIFRAFELCSYNDLKIIFLGQDPFSQKGVATGILFGNHKETKEENLSPSLEVIKEAAIDFEIPHNAINFDITLESWAKQGILMLNSALTCEVNKIGSHVMIWRPFMVKLLQSLSINKTGIVYVLFGKQAQTFEPYINKQTNHIIKIEHPSYYARTKRRMPSRLFYDINSIIKGIYNEQINWYNEINI